MLNVLLISRLQAHEGILELARDIRGTKKLFLHRKCPAQRILNCPSRTLFDIFLNIITS